MKLDDNENICWVWSSACPTSNCVLKQTGIRVTDERHFEWPIITVLNHHYLRLSLVTMLFRFTKHSKMVQLNTRIWYITTLVYHCGLLSWSEKPNYYNLWRPIKRTSVHVILYLNVVIGCAGYYMLGLHIHVQCISPLQINCQHGVLDTIYWW